VAHPRTRHPPLAAGASAGHRVPGSDGKVAETGSLGEASASCAAGTGDGVTAGSVGWTTVTLPPGRYELLCNLPNHYADGMWQELIVSNAAFKRPMTGAATDSEEAMQQPSILSGRNKLRHLRAVKG